MSEEVKEEAKKDLTPRQTMDMIMSVLNQGKCKAFGKIEFAENEAYTFSSGLNLAEEIGHLTILLEEKRLQVQSNFMNLKTNGKPFLHKV